MHGRELFERWCCDRRNAVVLPGYAVEGTLAKEIQKKPTSIKTLAGRHIPLLAEVQPISFSGGCAHTHTRAHARTHARARTRARPRLCADVRESRAAHVDGPANMEFMEKVRAPHVVLVHGEKNEMRRLRSELVGRNRARVTKGDLAVHMPSNTQLVSLHFREEKVAKVIRSAVRVRARQLPHTA